MKRKFLIITLFVFNIFSNINCQNLVDSNMKNVNPFFRKMIYRSLVKIDKMNKKYENDITNKYKPIYIVNIKALSLVKKESEYAIFHYLRKKDYDNLDAIGYMSFGDYTILVYSDNCKDMLQNIIKIPKINNNVKEEIVFKHPTDLVSGETVTYIVKYKKHKYKIKKYID